MAALDEIPLELLSDSTSPTSSLTHWPSRWSRWTRYIRPTIASLIAALCSLSLGTMVAYPSPAVPDLNSHPNPLHLNIEEISWFNSLASLGGIPGAMISGWIMDSLGRKLGLMMLALPTVVSWVLILASQNPIMMYVARFLTGFSLRASLPIVGVYISEISPPSIRGLLMSLHELSMSFGVLLIYIVGAYIPWNWLAVLCAIISCLLCVLMVFMPESPRWLLMRGQPEAAFLALKWLHNIDPKKDSPTVSAQLAEIQNSVREASAQGRASYLEYLRPPLLIPFLLTQALFIVQELSGINVLRSGTVSIFKAAGSTMDPNMATITVGVVLVLGSITFTCIVELLERRTYAVVSNIMMCVGLVALGTFFKLRECGLEFLASTYLYWLPLFSMMFTVLGYTFGVGPLPYVITSEVFPTRARARASSMGCATLSLMAFLIVKLFPNMSYSFGTSGAYWFCGSVCIAGAIISGTMVPNTKGKSLEELHPSSKNDSPYPKIVT